MRIRTFGSMLVPLMAMSLTAHASSLVGDWQGTYMDTQPTATQSGTVDLLIESQVLLEPVDTITGYIDVVCTTGGAAGCGTGGYNAFSSGTFNPATGVVSFVLGADPSTTVTGTLSADGTGIAGTYLASDDSEYGNWSVTEVGPVPLPAPFWLLGFGVAGIGLVGQRRSSTVPRAAAA